MPIPTPTQSGEWRGIVKDSRKKGESNKKKFERRKGFCLHLKVKRLKK